MRRAAGALAWVTLRKPVACFPGCGDTGAVRADVLDLGLRPVVIIRVLTV